MSQGIEELAQTIETAIGPLTPQIRAALLAVDRKPFVRAVDQELAYENVALPLDTAAISSSARAPATVRRSRRTWSVALGRSRASTWMPG